MLITAREAGPHATDPVAGAGRGQNCYPSGGGAIGLANGSTSDISGTTICGNSLDQISGAFNDLGGNCITDVCDSDGDTIPDCDDPCPNWPYDCSEDGQTLSVAVGEPIQLAIDILPAGGQVQILAGVHEPTETLQVSGSVNLLGVMSVKVLCNVMIGDNYLDLGDVLGLEPCCVSVMMLCLSK